MQQDIYIKRIKIYSGREEGELVGSPFLIHVDNVYRYGMVLSDFCKTIDNQFLKYHCDFV